MVVIVTANREHALSWDVMNSAVPLPCGGYLLRNVFLEEFTLCGDDDDVERKLIVETTMDHSLK